MFTHSTKPKVNPYLTLKTAFRAVIVPIALEKYTHWRQVSNTVSSQLQEPKEAKEKGKWMSNKRILKELVTGMFDMERTVITFEWAFYNYREQVLSHGASFVATVVSPAVIWMPLNPTCWSFKPVDCLG